MNRLAALVTIVASCALSSGAATVSDCRSLHDQGKLTEARACFTGLLRDGNALTRAQAEWGLGLYDESNSQFRIAFKEQPKSAAVREQWGSMYLDHYQAGDAAKLFEEAIEIDPNFAPAYLGLARVAEEGYDKKAIEFAHQALEHDPKLEAAQALLAQVALEDNNPKLAAEEAQKALLLSPQALDAMAILAAMDWLNGKTSSEWMDHILRVDPKYGEAYATGGHFFEINRRYKEAIESYRKALELNPDLWATRSQLGLNLMRVGADDEAKEQLDRCFNAHYRDAQTVNGLRLLDTLDQYEFFKSGNTELMLNKKEAALLRPYMQPLLEKAVATYERKYKMKLPGTVRVEVYPNHEDFIVRTLGLPGQGGLLGVTFGMDVTMDSPSARAPGEFNWASTMWHELSHVYVLSATNHLVPRWFTEGLAVHEEGAASPDWGDRMTPEIVTAIKEKKLLPVLELDRGFIRPEYPGQVIVSYYEAGKMCDYIAQKWGNDAFLGMMHTYAGRKTTADAIQDNLHVTPAAFDHDFLAWLDGQTGTTVKHFDEWREGMRTVAADVKDGKRDEAIRTGMAIRDFYPDYVGGASDYELMVEAYIGKNDKTDAIAQLEKYRDLGGTNVDTLKKLAQLEQDGGKPAQAEDTLKKLNYLYPEDEEIHERLGGLLFDSGDAAGAVREYQALLTLKPSDTAASHYNLARALRAAHRTEEAKDQVLMALEAAPDYRPAQQLLLQLSQ